VVTRPCSRTRIRCRTVTTRVSGEAEARATVRAARKPPTSARRLGEARRPACCHRGAEALLAASGAECASRVPRRAPSLCGKHPIPSLLTRLPTEDANGPRRGSGPFVQEGVSSSTVPLAAAAAGTAFPPYQVRVPAFDPWQNSADVHFSYAVPRPRRRAGGVAHRSSGFERSQLRALPCEWGSHGRTRLSRLLHLRGRAG
jgi:hypothetical protein